VNPATPPPCALAQPRAAFAPGLRPLSFRRRRERDRAVLRALAGGDLRPGEARHLPADTADGDFDRDWEPPPQQLALALPREVADTGFSPRAARGAYWGNARVPDERPPFG